VFSSLEAIRVGMRDRDRRGGGRVWGAASGGQLAVRPRRALHDMASGVPARPEGFTV